MPFQLSQKDMRKFQASFQWGQLEDLVNAYDKISKLRNDMQVCQNAIKLEKTKREFLFEEPEKVNKAIQLNQTKLNEAYREMQASTSNVYPPSYKVSHFSFSSQQLKNHYAPKFNERFMADSDYYLMQKEASLFLKDLVTVGFALSCVALLGVSVVCAAPVSTLLLIGACELAYSIFSYCASYVIESDFEKDRLAVMKEIDQEIKSNIDDSILQVRFELERAIQDCHKLYQECNASQARNRHGFHSLKRTTNEEASSLDLANCVAY